MCFDQGFVEMSLRRQHERVPLVRRRVARIELDGPAEFSCRFFPAPVVDEETPGQRRMRLRQRLIQRDGFARVKLRLLVSLVNGYVAIVDVERVRIGEACVCQRVRRV